jgi:hypothetical protein
MSTAIRSPTTSASSIPQIFGFSRELSISPRDRMSIRITLASARFWIWLGPLTQVARAIEEFGKHYKRAQDPQRAHFVDLICKAFDEALNAGKQGEIDPVQASDAMTAYERMTGIRSASAEFS